MRKEYQRREREKEKLQQKLGNERGIRLKKRGGGDRKVVRTKMREYV